MKRLLLTLLITIGVVNLCSSQQAFYDVTPANGNGLRFWQSDAFKIHMGNLAEYHYGPVTDYSIKMNMDATAGRGWTWGIAGSTPVAAIGSNGNMQIAGSFQAGHVTATGSSSVEETIFNASNFSDQDFNVRVSAVGASSKRTLIGPSSPGRFSLGVGVGNGNEFLTILNGGNVGIGTTSPAAKLEINQAGGPSGQNVGTKIWAGNSSTYFGNSQMQFSYGGTGGGYSHAIKSRHNATAISGNAIDFYLWQPGDNVNGEGSLNVMSLNGGNVGIGTTSPSAGLEIFESSTNNLAFQLNSSGPGWGSGARFKNTSASGKTFGVYSGQDGIFHFADVDNGLDRLAIAANGYIGIGTLHPDYPLTVNGSIHAKEVRVDLNVPAPDYVFEKDYQLTSLQDIKTYIDQNKHLPEVPSAKEMEKNGVQLGEMNMLLLKKIEELTLHVIEQNNQIAQLKEENRVSSDSSKKIEELTRYITDQEKRIGEQEKRLKQLENNSHN